MSTMFQHARELLHEFKGDRYVFGNGCLARTGELAAELGTRAAVIAGGSGKDWSQAAHQGIESSLAAAGVTVVDSLVPGVRPNAPREDVLRLKQAVLDREPDLIVAAGSGSTIDAAKCAVAMAVLGETHADFEEYFGVGKVSGLLAAEGKSMKPLLAIQFAASSAAHLTKYSNITDPASAQKKLIVDEAVVPPRALFDFTVTRTQPRSLTADGALDGVAHALEVFYGATGDVLKAVRPIALLAIELIARHVKRACENPNDLEAREALGLGTDLGGYAIMVGGTNGGHLTSFSLVDILTHGRACAVMNPYYTVFFAPAIEDKLHEVGAIFVEAGYLKPGFESLAGRELGLAVAEGMAALSADIGFPTRLSQVDGFSNAHIERAIEAAKNPQLEMKLKAMPVPLSADTIDTYMRPILEAAREGDFTIVRNME